MNFTALLALMVCLCASCAAAVSGVSPQHVPNLEEEIREWRRRGLPETIMYPQTKDKLVQMFLLRRPQGLPSSYNRMDNVLLQKFVHYFMFNRKHPKSGVRFTRSLDQIKDTGFNATKPTKIIIHGFSNNITSEIYSDVVSSLLALSDFNVIGLDWGALAADPFYVTARSYVKPVGEDLAALLDFLAESTGLHTEDVHVIGHSLGAHIAGTCGKTLRAGRLSRITALDPALPLFSIPSEDRLSNTDAGVVDVIHTTAGFLGQEDAIGTVDFYPNGGGSPQPGCGTDLFAACSHSRSYQLLAESVLHEASFSATRCGSVEAARKGACSSVYAANMGYNLRFSKAGPYYLKTEGSPPYDVKSHSQHEGVERQKPKTRLST